MPAIREILAEGSASLAVAGIENPGLDASLLLAEVLGISRTSLLAAGLEPLAESSLAAFRRLIKRRLEGECVAYILGKKEFYGLEFMVNPSVLVPRPETELLVETVIEIVKSSRKEQKPKYAIRVLDLCTGSGAIAIALKHTMPELEVWATDISVKALETAKANAARLLPPGAISFCHGDLYDALPSIKKYYSQISHTKAQRHKDTKNSYKLYKPHSFSIPLTSYLLPFTFIISNPPYIPTAEIPSLSPEVRAEPVLALDGGKEGLDSIRNIILQAPEHLCPHGILLLEADLRQMKEIASLYETAGFKDITLYKDLSGNERVIGGQKE
ncbi:MAG: peptide chain release factor N(5)-glutamine methyltransferase [Treponema sp.]|nr:peptide chain release factor N(5)-glutamine methyltransferase [Treponema sp.]